MKRTKALIISLLTLSIMLVLSITLFAEGITAELTSTAKNIEAGDTVKVDIVFSEKVSGAQFTLVYDHDKLELVETPKAYKQAFVGADASNPDKIKCSLLNLNDATEKLMYAQFKVKEGVKVGDKLSVGIADVIATVVTSVDGKYEYKSTYPEVTPWEYTILSGEVGCEYLKVTVYKTEANRDADEEGLEYTFNPLASTGNFEAFEIPVDYLYYTIEAVTSDSDATVKYTGKTGKLTVGKSSTATITVTAPNGNTKKYVATLKTQACVHDYSEVDGSRVDSTCTNLGSYKEKCSICDNIRTNSIDKKAHTYVQSEVAPTCTEKGYTVNKCSVCAEEYTSNEKDALGHSYEAISTTSTCKVKGETTYKCSVCNDEHKRADTEFASHKYSSKVIEPTCKDAGKTVHTCEICSETYEDTHVDPKGHTYQKDVTAPTCITAGYTTYKCVDCAHTYVDDYTNALGHTFGEWKTEIAATSEKEGIAKRSCVVCSQSETQVIPKLFESSAGTTGDQVGTDWTFILMIILLIGVVILIVLLIVVYVTYKKKRDFRGSARK